MPTISDTQVINVVVNGQELPMRQRQSKSGNTCWAVLDKKQSGERYYNRFGVRIKLEVIKGKLPKPGDKITVANQEFTLVGTTNERGQQQVRLPKGTTLNVPGRGAMGFDFLITDVGDGEANLIASVYGKSSGGGRKGSGLTEL